MTKILIVDDEEHIRFVLRELLEEQNYIVFEASNGEKAIDSVKKHSPAVILLDFKLPDISGEEVLKRINKIDTTSKIIVLTAFADIKKAVVCMKSGAYDYITKPFDNNEIVLVIKKAIKEYQLENEVKILRKCLLEKQLKDKIIAESLNMKKIIRQVEIVAPTDITVLIQGETGTGKEIVANLIHNLSARAKKPFIAVDCGSIPETLFESEMFGYKKGAFTGAINNFNGKFMQANGGTLFLDEITNLSLNTQAKLLRILQDKKMVKVGSDKMIKLDIRIIAATNEDIEAKVKNGQFRSDLFFRLNEYIITLPPLRERKDDIPAFVEHFRKVFNEELNKNILSVSPDVMQTLLNYDWSGNIRELRNVIKRAVLLAQGNVLNKEHLLLLKNEFENDTDTSFEELSVKELKTKINAIKDAIEKAGGNKSKAAEMLRISRNKMYRIIAKAKEKGLKI